MILLDHIVACGNLVLPSITQDLQLVENGERAWRLVTMTKPGLPAYQLELLVRVQQVDQTLVNVLIREEEPRAMCLIDDNDCWEFICLAIEAYLTANPDPKSQDNWEKIRDWLNELDEQARTWVLTGCQGLQRYMPPTSWSLRLMRTGNAKLWLSKLADGQLAQLAGLAEFRKFEHGRAEILPCGDTQWLPVTGDGYANAILAASEPRQALADLGVMREVTKFTTEKAKDWSNLLEVCRSALRAVALFGECSLDAYGEGPNLTVLLVKGEQRINLMQLRTVFRDHSNHEVQVTLGERSFLTVLISGADIGFVTLLVLALLKAEERGLWEQLDVEYDEAELLDCLRHHLPLMDIGRRFGALVSVQWSFLLFNYWKLHYATTTPIGVDILPCSAFEKHKRTSVAFTKAVYPPPAGKTGRVCELLRLTFMELESEGEDQPTRLQMAITGYPPEWLPEDAASRFVAVRDRLEYWLPELLAQLQEDQPDGQAQSRKAKPSPRGQAKATKDRTAACGEIVRQIDCQTEEDA